jgi:hypothetical protein
LTAFFGRIEQKARAIPKVPTAAVNAISERKKDDGTPAILFRLPRSIHSVAAARRCAGRGATS